MTFGEVLAVTVVWSAPGAIEECFEEAKGQSPSPAKALRGVCIGFHVGAWRVISKLGLGSGHGSGSSHTRRQSLP